MAHRGWTGACVFLCLWCASVYCGGCITCSAKRHQPTGASEAAVIEWLNQWPFANRDNSWVALPPHEPFDVWLKHGAAIDRVGDALTRLLITRDPRTWPPQVACALGEYGSLKSVPALIGALRDESAFYDLRSMAAGALGRLKARESVAALEHAAASDKVSDVRLNSIWALGEIGDPSARPVLEEAARKEDDFIRGVALTALAKIDAAR